MQFANHRGQICTSSSGRYGGTTSRSETQLRSLQAASEVERAELAARQATEQTMRHVKETRKALEEAERALSLAKVESKTSDHEMERQYLGQSSTSSDKAVALQQHKNARSLEPLLEEEEGAERYQALSDLRAEERLLAETAMQVDAKAAKLLSRASTMQDQAATLSSKDQKTYSGASRNDKQSKTKQASKQPTAGPHVDSRHYPTNEFTTGHLPNSVFVENGTTITATTLP